MPPGFPVGAVLFRWPSQQTRRSLATVELYVLVVGVVDVPDFVRCHHYPWSLPG